jgi:hypothetical protein
MKNDLRAEHLSQEVTVVLPLGVLLRITEQVPQPTAAAPGAFANLPSIGAAYQGGIYAGLSVENERPVALVLLQGDESLAWHDAAPWAEKQGGVLPSRIDQLVLFKNLKGEFKEAWYWSGEQFAGYEDSAWFQGFGFGGQYDGRKGDHYRVRAVRRLPIQ